MKNLVKPKSINEEQIVEALRSEDHCYDWSGGCDRCYDYDSKDQEDDILF